MLQCIYLVDTGEISGSGQKLFHCEMRNINIGAEATLCPCRYFVSKDWESESYEEEIGPDSAQKIINSLQNGVPPSLGIDVFGFDDQKELVSNHLEDVSRGYPHFFIVIGHYGTGKSHFLQFIFNQALENNFVASKISLKPECNFASQLTVYSEIMKCLTVPDNKKAEAIDWIAKKIGKRQLPPTVPSNIALAFEKAADYAGPKRRLFLDYICGRVLPVSELRKLASLPKIKIKLENEDFSKLIKGISQVCVPEYSGLVVIFDEVENILQSGSTYQQTEKAILNIVDLITNFRYLSNVYLVFGVTPDVFGILKKRGAKLNESNSSNLTLPAKEDLIALGKQIRKVHSVAYGSKAESILSDAMIAKIATRVMSDRTNVREFVRSIVYALNVG